VRSLDSLLASGVAIRVAVVPSPTTPTASSRNLAAKSQAMIAKAEGFFDYYLNRLCVTNASQPTKAGSPCCTSMGAAVHKTARRAHRQVCAKKRLAPRRRSRSRTGRVQKAFTTKTNADAESPEAENQTQLNQSSIQFLDWFD